MTLDKYDLVVWFKCPACGSDGCQNRRYDFLFKKEVTEFCCDKDERHHFLIFQLEPYEIEDLEDQGSAPERTSNQKETDQP